MKSNSEWRRKGWMGEMVGDLLQASPQEQEERKQQPALLQRYRHKVVENAARLQGALSRSSTELVDWVQLGGPWRAFSVISLGSIVLVSLTGLLAFLLFFVTATVNAVVIAFLISGAAVGAFAGLFFASLAAIYVGALSVAVVVLSTIAFFTICAILFTAGWIGLLWVIWLGVKLFIDYVQGFVSGTTRNYNSVSEKKPKQSSI